MASYGLHRGRLIGAAEFAVKAKVRDPPPAQRPPPSRSLRRARSARNVGTAVRVAIGSPVDGCPADGHRTPVALVIGVRGDSKRTSSWRTMAATYTSAYFETHSACGSSASAVAGYGCRLARLGTTRTSYAVIRRDAGVALIALGAHSGRAASAVGQLATTVCGNCLA